MTIALMRDSENFHEHMGRDASWYVLADIYDATNQNTRATGNWKKGKTPEFEPYPRPGRSGKKKSKRGKKAGDKKRPTTVADIYSQFTGAPASTTSGGPQWQVR